MKYTVDLFLTFFIKIKNFDEDFRFQDFLFEFLLPAAVFQHQIITIEVAVDFTAIDIVFGL